MGHQFPRAVVAATLTLGAAACGGSDGGGDPPPVLEVARGQVESGARGSTGEQSADGSQAGPTELPPPDPSAFEGAHRVVNLFAEPVGGDAGPTAIDVWGRRTFEHGPVLLAENVGFGAASGYFAAPVGSSVVIVSAGAGPDGEERAVLPDVGDTDQVTSVFTNGADPASERTSAIHEVGADLAPAPPAEGHGIVIVVAANLQAFRDELLASVGADSFFVGDGSDTCRTQRIEATGAAPAVLGTAERVELEVASGSAQVSLHAWSPRGGCDGPSILDATVDVVAGSVTTLLVSTRDGSGLSSLALPAGG
ncbi:MAG: hypothetical protein R8G01_01070 [Ilumatobacteraceae bacterium]|nr:hypothetical protein [Ilumatobacteraceae bacterium]